MNIYLIGKPASGKGTITKLLEKEGFVHLSTGDLLRQEVSTNSKMGQEIEALLAQGQFATDETIYFLVDKFLDKHAGKQIIFDGFPRTVGQAQVCLDRGIVFDKVIFLDVSDDVVRDRIVNRRVHPGSGRVYNIKTMPPKVDGVDDETGEPLVHRTDDKAEIVDQRLSNFKNKTLPIVDFLKDKNFEILNLNAENEISSQLKEVKAYLALKPVKTAKKRI